MQIEQTENELIIRESPGCLWILGLIFGLVGGMFVYGAIDGYRYYDRQTALMLILTFVIGSIAVSAGVWTIYGATITKVVIDRVENVILMTRFGLFGKRETLYDFDEIERFCLVEEKDDKGDDVWFLGIRLIDGETIKISSFASHDELFKLRFVSQTNEFTRKQMPMSEMIFELEDESEEEMS